MKNILHRMLSGSFLTALFLSLAAPSMTRAAEVPESGIDYTESYLHFTYANDIAGGPVNIPGDRECFGQAFNNTSGQPLSIINRQLSELGVTSSNGLLNIIDGDDTTGCFQKSGTYYMQFKLKDNAGNCGWYPHGSTECLAYDPNSNRPPVTGGVDHPHWYKFVVKPATPDAGNTTFIPSTGEVRANGNEFYTVDITFRDEFGNVVTQLTDPNDVTVKVATDASGIFVDGILTEVPDNSEITTDEEAYKNTGSETTFAQGVKLGDTNGTKVTLASLLGSGGTLPSSTLTNVSPGVFRFEVSSDVPSMKLFDSSSTNVVDAGVYKQPLDFDTETAQIENDGSVGSTKEGLLSGTVSAVFAFHPIFQAIPGALGSNVTWGETAGLITNLVFNSSETNSEKYLLLTPFIDYFLQKYTPPSGLIPESYDNVKLPFVGTGTGDNTEADIAFFPAVGDVASSPPSNIGLAAQVQYEIGGKTIRHVSGDNSGACPSGEYEKCFLFDPSTSARIIGADIEGAFQGERSEVLVYQLAGSTGDQTSYAGTINNDRLRNGLFKSIDNAVRNPQTELTGPQNLALNSGATALTFGDNDTIVVRGDLILGDGDSAQGENFNAPSGAKTIIVVDGNVFVEDSYWYDSELGDSLGIITYNTSQSRADGATPETGNIIVHEDVKHMVGTYYVDGSLISVGDTNYANRKSGASTVESLSYDGDKTTQLILEGVIWSGNTLGGSLLKDVDKFISPWQKDGESSIVKAKLFDLHFMRRFAGSGAGCTGVSSSDATCDPNTNAFVIRLDNKATYSETAPPVFRDLPEIAQ